MKKIIIFASGAGTNAFNIINYFREKSVDVSLIVSNNPNAGVKQIAEEYSIPFQLITTWEEISERICLINPSLIVLAGFLKKIPESFLESISCRVINIHPSLLPKYGGKGFYGDRVHQAVLDNNEKEHGVTIHYVDKNYDEGTIIFQEKINIEDVETLDQLASKIHELEYKFYPTIIEKLL